MATDTVTKPKRGSNPPSVGIANADEAKGKQTMKLEYIPQDEFNAIIKAARRGGWTERATTFLDTDLNVTKCLFEDGAYIVVDDAYAVTVLRIDGNGFVSEIKEID